MKASLRFLPLLILLSACGSEGGPEGLFFRDTVEVQGGKSGINVITGVDAQDRPTVRYLGHIENIIGVPVCRINIAFTTFNAQGEVDTEHAPEDIHGTTFLAPINSDKPQDLVETNNCLEAEDSGVFDTGPLVLTEAFSDGADFDFQLCVEVDPKKKACDDSPSIKKPFISLDLASPIGIAGENSEGFRIFNGKVQTLVPEDSPVTIAHDVHIHFTIFGDQPENKGKIIGTTMSKVLTSSDCDIPRVSALSCLVGNGAEAIFNIVTETLAEKTCDSSACYEYRIYHKEPSAP